MKLAHSKQTDTPSPETKLNSGTPCHGWLWVLKCLEFSKWTAKATGGNSAVFHSHVPRKDAGAAGVGGAGQGALRHRAPGCGTSSPISWGIFLCFCLYPSTHTCAVWGGWAALILQRQRGHMAGTPQHATCQQQVPTVLQWFCSISSQLLRCPSPPLISADHQKKPYTQPTSLSFLSRLLLQPETTSYSRKAGPSVSLLLLPSWCFCSLLWGLTTKVCFFSQFPENMVYYLSS